MHAARLASFSLAGRATFGTVSEGEVVDVGAALNDPRITTLREYLAAGSPDIAEIAARARHVPEEDIVYLPLIPDAQLIICVGLNFASHIAEMKRELPKFPTLFSRTYRSQIGHKQILRRPEVSHSLDYEGELAVVIGRGGRQISSEDALNHVAGFSCYNDGTVRDYQRHTTQFLPGKNFRGTGAFGPWLVPATEWQTIRSGRLITRLNGAVMQDAPLDDLIFDVPDLISYISSFTDLEPGDVIVTGTPGGVGVARTPPVYMQAGDKVEVEITGIGTLSNTIDDEANER